MVSQGGCKLVHEPFQSVGFGLRSEEFFQAPICDFMAEEPKGSTCDLHSSRLHICFLRDSTQVKC